VKTRPRKKTIGIVSLGCAKNLVDTERLYRQLEGPGVSILFDPSGPGSFDTVIINTCGFIGDAKQESIDHILQYSEAKKKGKISQLLVMGCLSERYKARLSEEIPEVDGYYGVNELAGVVSAAGGDFRKELLGERHLTTPGHYAYLKIAEGCDRKCSFCAIPAIRGTHRSRVLEDIIAEAELLASRGVRELLVISQDTTYYGVDLYGKRMISPLLTQLSGIEGIEWVRLHYTYPHGFPMDLLDVMRDNPGICRYIDIPLQHISDRILRSMKRGMTGPKTRDLVHRIRAKVRGVAIRTTFIVGYPGETAAEFRELREFVRESQFERVGVFTYSEEEGTPAAQLKDTVPYTVKARRAEELMALQEQISFDLNFRRVGSRLKVVIDGEEGDWFTGRTEFDSPEVDNGVFIKKGNRDLHPGEFYETLITDAGSYDLFGE
jgi:ribosomal protein S12 methylthiotransferase